MRQITGQLHFRGVSQLLGGSVRLLAFPRLLDPIRAPHLPASSIYCHILLQTKMTLIQFHVPIRNRSYMCMLDTFRFPSNTTHHLR